MKTIENLKDDYLRIANWHGMFRKMLNEFLDNGLATCKDGVAVLDVKYKSFDEAEKDGGEFYDQFPVCITILDKHGFNHEIYVTKLYKKNDLFFVDGYDSSDGEWIEGWYTDNSNDVYDDLSTFLSEVLGLTDTEGVEPTVVVDENQGSDKNAILMGYQLLDVDDCYPSEFGEWDVFRTKEDAEMYRKEVMLDTEEWQVNEVWDSPEMTHHYRFHEIKERTFHKGEKVLVILPMDSYFAFIREDVEVKSGSQRIGINEFNLNHEWVQTAPDNEFIYQQDESLKCPGCGKPMYSAWRTNLAAHCPECEGLCRD